MPVPAFQTYLPSGMGSDPIASTVVIQIPLVNGCSLLRGLLDSDISISLSNTWGSLLPDISGLADIAQIANSISVPAWIGASAQAWKGTGPIRLPLSFYLINYAPDLDYEGPLKHLAQLCTLSESGAEVGKDWTVNVHAGYQAHFLSNNSMFFDSKLSAREGGLNTLAGTGGLVDIGAKLNTKNIGSGTISVKIGNKLKLSNLLLSKLNITASNVEVASKDGSNIKPLYYKVDMDLQTCRAALDKDIEDMFS